MSAINRDVTRAIIDLGTPIEVTQGIKTPSSDQITFNLTTTNKFYLGLQAPFATRHFQFATPNTESTTVSVKTWDGSQFEDVKDIVDQTEGFIKDGFISWINTGSWKASKIAPISDVDLFWAEITVSANLSATTQLQSVLNIFCDDNVFKGLYPDIFSDDRYKPPGVAHFYDQYILAKDMVVDRLRDDSLIKRENQVLDINDVARAAAYATAYIILEPIAQEDGDVQRATSAENRFIKELNRKNLKLDFDESGITEEDEKEFNSQFSPRGGFY